MWTLLYPSLDTGLWKLEWAPGQAADRVLQHPGSQPQGHFFFSCYQSFLGKPQQLCLLLSVQSITLLGALLDERWEERSKISEIILLCPKSSDEFTFIHP